MQYLVNHKDETFEKVRTTVFVDYETWFYGCRNQYQTDPDVADWFNHVKDKGQIDDVLFFADFSHESIKDHIVKLRNISNSIIDCSKGEKNQGLHRFHHAGPYLSASFQATGYKAFYPFYRRQSFSKYCRILA